MADWYSNIYKACILSSVIAFIIAIFTKSQTSLGAYIAGYSVLVLGVMMILIILFDGILRMNGGIKQIINISGPFLLMFGIVSFMLYLLIRYRNNIIDGHVSPGYNTFNIITILLILGQVFLLYRSNNTDKVFHISKTTTSIIYLLGVLTAISTITLYTILKYYSTDGFTQLS